MAPIVDCHTHTSFSDGASTFAQNVRAAAARGCRVLVSTDHLTLPASMDPQASCQVRHDQLADHRTAFDEAAGLAHELTAHADTPLELVWGFECDWYAGCEHNVSSWTRGAVVRLGSVHWLRDPGDTRLAARAPGSEQVSRADAAGRGAGWLDDPDDLHLWHELGPDEVWRRYVSAWCAACESPLAFSSMAHPDLPMRFVNEGQAPSIDLGPLWDEMAACAHDTGRRVEVSSAGLRKSVGSFYPAAGLLARFAASEVPITVGSDAHRACDVCWGIAEAYRHAQAAGYRSMEVPHADGSWESVALG